MVHSIDGTSDERKPNEYPSIRLWHYLHKYNYRYHCDKFGSKRKHKEKVNLLIFHPEIVSRADREYNTKASIQTKISSANTPEDPEGTEGF